MHGVAATVVIASVLFAGTNVDDLVVLGVLNASSRAEGRPRRWHIWVGQYAGLAVLVGASLLAAAGLTVLPEGRICAAASPTSSRGGATGLSRRSSSGSACTSSTRAGCSAFDRLVRGKGLATDRQRADGGFVFAFFPSARQA